MSHSFSVFLMIGILIPLGLSRNVSTEVLEFLPRRMRLLTPTPPAQPQLPSLERNSIWVQHKGDSEDMFAIALQVPLRAVKIRQLSFKACHS
jgi:hypothetical protein